MICAKLLLSPRGHLVETMDQRENDMETGVIQGFVEGMLTFLHDPKCLLPSELFLSTAGLRISIVSPQESTRQALAEEDEMAQPDTKCLMQEFLNIIFVESLRRVMKRKLDT